MGLKRDILIGLGVLGVILIIVGILIGLVVLLTKALGLVLILAGVFLAVFFPDIEEFQPFAMSKAGILLGILLAAIGLLLVLA